MHSYGSGSAIRSGMHGTERNYAVRHRTEKGTTVIRI